MKISFEANIPDRTEKERTQRTNSSKIREGILAYQVELHQDTGENWEKGSPGKGPKGKSLEELQQEAGNKDAQVLQDYMTVMSHTVSSKDYARIEEEGFSLENMDPRDSVTIVDKIKAQLALSGKEIIGYTDDIDMDTLTEAVGSQGLARAISDSFKAADIPMTMENIEKAAQACNMSAGLEAPGEGEYGYMVDNEMEPTIRDFYMAQNSGAAQDGGSAPDYYADEVQGYYSRKADASQLDNLQEQVVRVIEQAGLEVNQTNMDGAAWLLEKGLPLTGENLKRLDSLKEISFPVSQEQAAFCAAQALSQGKEAMEGNLGQKEDIYSHGARVAEYFSKDENFIGTRLADRRLLEEIRLRMTAEVNVKLIKSGFAIDTAPMEELIEALKQAEQEIAEQYFPEDDKALVKYRQYHTACEAVKEIPLLPLDVLGRINAHQDSPSLEEFHAQGKQLQQAYQEAGERYETLMTSPRSDMGDSIAKAFANVDDILEDMGWECTEANRKAARILGYNSMEITPENLDRVKEAEGQVRLVAEKMTPAATLKMIRDGVNPLETSMEDLEEYLNKQPQTFDEQAKSYSKFLHGLEKNGEITQREREAYIGIYRLLHQIERSDGAVVGSLVNAQAELNFSNLLSAVRSRKAKGTDIKVTDAVGTLTGLAQKGMSISQQIASGYQNVWEEVVTDMSYSQEAEADFNKQNLDLIRQSVSCEQECIAMLQRGEIPVTAQNLLAAQGLRGQKGAPFQRFLEEQKEDEQTVSFDGEDMTEMSDSGRLENMWELLDKKEDFQKSYKEAIGQLESQTENSLLEDAGTSIDVRELQLVHKQLYITGALSEQEEYNIPMYLGDELTCVRLTIRQEKDSRGNVQVSMDRDGLGHLEGILQVRRGKVSGYFTGSTQEAVTELRKAADIFGEESPVPWEMGEIPVFLGSVQEFGEEVPKEGVIRDLSDKEDGSFQERVSNEQLYQVAKRFLSAVKNSVSGS